MPKNAAQLWIQLCDFTLSSQFFFPFTFNICVNKENYENTEKKKKIYIYQYVYFTYTNTIYIYCMHVCVCLFKYSSFHQKVQNITRN